ncbi:MAG: hypothetical protein ACRD29_19905 [Acidimicrobiales bacterium]
MGTVADRLIKPAEEWLFLERRSTAVAAHALTREEFNFGGSSPGVTNPETSYDLVGPDALM